MKSDIFVVSFGLLIAVITGCTSGENDSFGILKGPDAVDNMAIDEAIESVTDQKQKKFLSDFKKGFSQEDDMRVTSKGRYFEIIVSHPSRDNDTGGAEQYFLDKETGRSKMGWHEHPMPLDIPEQ